MTGWTAHLDDWQAWLDRLQAALDSGDWDELAEQRWQPPADMTEFPDEAEQQRLRGLTVRAADLQARLEAAVQSAAEGLADQRKARGAHDAYRQGGRRPRR